MGGFSAHAGQTDLLNWFAVVAPSRPRIIITHGDDRARTVLAGLISARHGLKPELPGLGEVIEI
jgi:metallo-beta-lactamase family protein